MKLRTKNIFKKNKNALHKMGVSTLYTIAKQEAGSLRGRGKDAEKMRASL